MGTAPKIGWVGTTPPRGDRSLPRRGPGCRIRDGVRPVMRGAPEARRLALAAGLLVALAAGLQAPGATFPSALADPQRSEHGRLRVAVARSLRQADLWLVSQQREDGRWQGREYSDLGLTALAVAALEGSTEAAAVGARRRGQAAVRALLCTDLTPAGVSRACEDWRARRTVYELSVSCLALSEPVAQAGLPGNLAEPARGASPADRILLGALAEVLRKGLLLPEQGVERGWGYRVEDATAPPAWKLPKELEARSRINRNLSCTEFAILGLHTAQQCGVVSDDAFWARAARAVLSYRGGGGGFFYLGAMGSTRCTGGMTTVQPSGAWRSAGGGSQGRRSSLLRRRPSQTRVRVAGSG